MKMYVVELVLNKKGAEGVASGLNVVELPGDFDKEGNSYYQVDAEDHPVVLTGNLETKKVSKDSYKVTKAVERKPSKKQLAALEKEMLVYLKAFFSKKRSAVAKTFLEAIETMLAVETVDPTDEAIRSLVEKAVKYRKSIGLAQKEVAARSGLSQGLICSIEKGKQGNPNLKTFMKYLDAVGMELVVEDKVDGDK